MILIQATVLRWSDDQQQPHGGGGPGGAEDCLRGQVGEDCQDIHP